MDLGVAEGRRSRQQPTGPNPSYAARSPTGIWSLETRVDVKLISRGRWDAERTRTSPDGYTLWGVRHGGRLNVGHFDEVPDVINAIVTQGSTEDDEYRSSQ